MCFSDLLHFCFSSDIFLSPDDEKLAILGSKLKRGVQIILNRS